MYKQRQNMEVLISFLLLKSDGLIEYALVNVSGRYILYINMLS